MFEDIEKNDKVQVEIDTENEESKVNGKVTYVDNETIEIEVTKIFYQSYNEEMSPHMDEGSVVGFDHRKANVEKL